MNSGRIVKNYFKLAVNVLWRKFTGRFCFPLSCLSILEKTLPRGKQFSFVQVGANDGVSNDFLYAFVRLRDARGIVIEPVKEYYDHLVSNYRYNNSIIPLNMAVHASKKRLELYKVKAESLKNLPEWASGIASSDPTHHLTSGIDAKHIQTVTADADTLMNIVRPYGLLKKIDFLQIDVEGYDDEVVSQINFQKLQPKIIRFEYMNLPESKTVETIRLLKRNGYFCYYDTVDVVAFLPKEVVL